MELDGDEVAITYIKDVTFNANRPDVDAVKMNKVRSHRYATYTQWITFSS